MRYFLMLLLVACSSPTEPPLQMEQTPVPYTDPVLEQVWIKTEQCSGLTGDFSSVHYFTVPATYVVVDGVEYYGFWFRDGNRIVMGHAWAANQAALMHEDMHALLQRSDHPAQYFDGPCGKL